MTALDLDARRPFNLRLHNVLARVGLGGGHPVAVRPEGGHFVVSCDGHEIAMASATRWRLYRRGWDARMARLSHQFGVGSPIGIGPGDTVIDIGANVGEFTLAQAARGARVFAIEGDPAVFDCLRLNTAGNPAITPVQALIWKEEADLTFYSAPRQSDSSVFRPTSGETLRELRLPATTLDRLAERLGIDGVTLLKCDAEGAEPEVIEGGRALLARTRHVAFDTGPERMGQETSQEVERLLTALGFTVRHETRHKRKITFGDRAGPGER